MLAEQCQGGGQGACPPYPHSHLRNERDVDSMFSCAHQPSLVETMPRVRCGAECVFTTVRSRVPMMNWLPRYKWRAQLKGDVISGLTLGVMLIPQGLAYAMLANLPAYYGLYACLGPALVYSAMGTSSQLHIGPFALISLLVAEGVSKALPVDVSEAVYVDSVLLMSIIVGVYLVCMGLLRMGFVVSFLAEPVLSGFTTASAFLIATSQVKDVFGLKLGKNLDFIQTWIQVFSKIKHTNPATLIMAVFTIILLLLMRWMSKKYKERLKGVPVPGELVVLILGTMIVGFGHLNTEFGVRTVGYVPPGLPSFRLPHTAHLLDLFGPSASLALMLYVMSISTAKTFAMKNGYQVDPNQELLALGVANILGGFWQAYPASGSLSRTALVHAVGASSPLHNVVCVVVMVVLLLCITPLLRNLPMAVLASIILVALQSLFEQVREPLRLWKLQRSAALLWALTFLATLAFGTNTGLGLGVLASMVMLMRKTSRPSVAVMGRLPGTDIYRNVRRYPAAREFPGILIFRFDDALHFANKDYFKETLLKLIKDHSTMTELYTVIVEAAAITEMDASAMDMLLTLAKDIKADLLFAGCKGRLRDRLSATGLFSNPCVLGPTNRAMFVSLDDAVRWAQDKNMQMLMDVEERARQSLHGGLPVPNGSGRVNPTHDSLGAYQDVRLHLREENVKAVQPQQQQRQQQHEEGSDDEGGFGGHGAVDDWRTDHDLGPDFDLEKKKQELQELEQQLAAAMEEEEAQAHSVEAGQEEDRSGVIAALLVPGKPTSEASRESRKSSDGGRKKQSGDDDSSENEEPEYHL